VISTQNGNLINTVSGKESGIKVTISQSTGVVLNFNESNMTMSFDDEFRPKAGNYTIGIDLSLSESAQFGITTNFYQI
jgi:hypothetical protein